MTPSELTAEQLQHLVHSLGDWFHDISSTCVT